MYEIEFIDDLDDDTHEAHFLVRGVTPAFANGIRRAMIADVPTMSVDTVRMIENSSVMFDEQIGHRLGMVPLTTPVGEYELGDTVTLSMDVAGPATAYSGDLVTSDRLVQPATDDVPIIDLKQDQRLELEADAVLDTGKDHAKHQGGVAVGYRHLQRIDVVGDAAEYTDDEPRVIRGVVEDDGDLVSAETFDNDLSERYPDKEVTVEDVPNAFVFHVETDGSFAVEDLVLEAVDSIESRAQELETAVQL